MAAKKLKSGDTYTLKEGEGPAVIRRRLVEDGNKLAPGAVVNANPGCSWAAGEKIVIPEFE